jgi:hypothetical protein
MIAGGAPHAITHAILAGARGRTMVCHGSQAIGAYTKPLLHRCMISIRSPSRCAGDRCVGARNEPTAAVMAVGKRRDGLRNARNEPRICQNGGRLRQIGPAAATKRSQWASFRTGTLRNEPTASAERSGNRATEPTAPAARHLDRANEATVMGVERIAPIGRIASAPRRNCGDANRQNRAMIIPQDGFAPIGEILPASGDARRMWGSWVPGADRPAAPQRGRDCTREGPASVIFFVAEVG